MNVYDSARMADVLAPLGYGTAESPADADMVILNTCHIREKASEKVFSELGRLRQARAARKETGADMIIAVAGCVAQAEGAEILRRAPDVDIVLGPQTYHRLPEMVARAARARSAKEGNGRRGAGVLDTDFPPESKFDHLPAPTVNPGADQAVSAFLAVQEGCDKFCTFCVVPYTRGAEFSRPGGAGHPGSAGAGRRRRARDQSAGPERQCLSRRSARMVRSGAWAGWSGIWPTASMACCASATPPRTRATWTMT